VVNSYNDLSVDMNLDPQTATKLRQLAEAKTRAVDQEDYLTAKEIKSVEQELKMLGSKLAQLDMAKAAAVADEDYDLAQKIKDDCDELREQIEEKVTTSIIPSYFLDIKVTLLQRLWQFEFLAWTSTPNKFRNLRPLKESLKWLIIMSNLKEGACQQEIGAILLLLVLIKAILLLLGSRL